MIRTARNPESRNAVIRASASTSVDARTSSSTAPTTSPGPGRREPGREERHGCPERDKERQTHGDTLARECVKTLKGSSRRFRAGRASTSFATARARSCTWERQKSLRSRVRSYFQRGDARFGAARLVERVDDVEVIVTRTEAEALHLEQNLVKRHRPPFNIRLRDDKSFPYIAVTLTDEYPRVMFTARAAPARDPLLRPVREREEGAGDPRRAQPRLPLPPLRRASAGPALGDSVPRLPHRPLLRTVHRSDLEGGLRRGHRRRRRLPVRRHEDHPGRADRAHARGAADERFEEAARYRNRLFAIRHLADRQATERRRSEPSTSSASRSTATGRRYRSSRCATGR